MTVTYASFVAGLPEFANPAQYSQASIEFWIAQAPSWISKRFRTDQVDLATMLWVAHNRVLGKRDEQAAAAGGVPGEAKGPVTAKSVDKVSVGYSTGTTIEGAGPWNATTYGQRFYQMSRGTNVFMAVPGPRSRFGLRSRFTGYDGSSGGLQ